MKFDRTQDMVRQWLKPHHTTHQAYSLTRSKLSDPIACKDITRDLNWGVEVPEIYGVKNQVFYVWFDAPLGYISITANHTPHWRKIWTHPSTKLYHFIGKDNILFHTLYFPATLMGADLGYVLPHHISVTNYLTFEGQKFSKRNGTGIFGLEAASSGVEGDMWRFALLRLRPERSDTDFSVQFLLDSREWYRKNVANLCSRVTKFLQKKYGNVVMNPFTPAPHPFDSEVMGTVSAYHRAMNLVELKEGLTEVMKLTNYANLFLTESKFWTLVDSSAVIFKAVNLLGLLSVMWEPFTPSLSRQICHQLNNCYEMKFLGPHEFYVPPSTTIRPSRHLMEPLPPNIALKLQK
jgi:methionyl-tRNA synthetase